MCSPCSFFDSGRLLGVQPVHIEGWPGRCLVVQQHWSQAAAAVPQLSSCRFRGMATGALQLQQRLRSA